MHRIADYYNILDINTNATQDEIKRAFRNLAKEWHPDTGNHDRDKATKRFAEISTAYEILSDSEKRKKYDYFRNYSYGYSTNGRTFASGYRQQSREDEWEELSRWFQDIYEKHLNGLQQHLGVLLLRIRRGFIGAAIGLSIGLVFRGIAIPLMVLGWFFGYYLMKHK